MAGAKGAGARGGKGKGKKRARAAAAADAPGAEEEHARAARRAKVRGTDPIPHTPTRQRVVKAPTGRSACAQNTPLRLSSKDEAAVGAPCACKCACYPP